MTQITWILIAVLLSIAPGAYSDDTERLIKRANRYFEPLPETMPGAENDTPEQIALGKELYFDPRLSINDTQSCASCHRLEEGFAGVDNLPLSPGAKGEVGTRNSPTVLNAGWQRLQFWDGRAEDLVEQAKGPILNPLEMAMPDEAAVEDKIHAIESYRDAFAKAFPGGEQSVTFQRIVEAIATFERTLRSESRFDDFLNGDGAALNETEKQGLVAFIKLDCISCHDGALVGGESFEPLGKENPYDNQSDLGLYELSKDEEDRMVFKVSSLRNVDRTAPYFHDGRIKTLPEAVRSMARLQLDEELTDQQVKEITSFLKALSEKSSESPEKPPGQ